MATIQLDPETRAEFALADDLERFRGQWVAVRQHAVVASGATFKELRDRISAEGLEVEVAFQVPEGDASACFF